MSASSDIPSERNGIQVIARAAGLLRALERHPDGMTLGELAKAQGLARSTVQRIVDALHQEGFVIAASSSSGVRLGPALLALAAATRFGIAQAARETLETLAKECGETVDLALADQDQVIFVDQIAGRHRLAAVSAVGLSFPLYSSANGKAVLAAMDANQIEGLRKRIKLRQVTSHTLTSWEDLERQLVDIRKTGIAYDHEENSEGISAMSMAIRGPSGEIAAISIPAPTARFQVSRARLEKSLRRHCGELQRKIKA